MDEKIRLKYSIRWKFLFTTIGLIVSLLVIFTFILILSQKVILETELQKHIDLIKENLHERSITLSDNLAFHIEDAIASFNLTSVINQIDNDVKNHKELDYIILVDSEGVAHIHTKKPQLQETKLTEEEDTYALVQKKATINEFEKYGIPYMELIVPIEISNELWGILRLGYSLEELNRVISDSQGKIQIQIRNIVLRSVLTAIIFIIAGSIIVLLLTSKLSKPLIKLTETAHELAMGNFDATDKIAFQSKDEVGVLAQTFIEMSKKLKTSYEKLEEYSHNLEQKVKERTIELAEARDQAVTANKSKTRFLANMSHEIRTPLTSIIGFSSILLIKKGKGLLLPNEFKQFLEIIKSSGENLSELINNILDLSKIEAGKTTISMENINLKLLVQEIFHINRAHAMKKNIQFIYTYDPRLPEIIYSDRTKLNQILMNITSNAIKFTPDGKAVSLNALREEDFIIFKVEDQGIGIPIEKQESIFEPFEQAETSTTRHYGGTGLGLSIAKSMAEVLGGKIELKSEKAKGSTFLVKIPLVESSEGAATAHEESNWDDIRFFRDNKILVVEDNIINQEMIQALFKTFDMEVHIADNGQSAIKMAIDLKPDLILMDMHMPGMDGIEAARKILLDSRCKDIPVVALSANAFSEQQQEAREAGVSDYLTKPLNINKLIPLLMKYLRYKQALLSDDAANNPPLPDDIRSLLIDEFKILSEIPFYLTGKIASQFRKMLKLCEGHDSPFPEILKQVEDAAFSRDSKKMEDLIKEAVNYAENKRRYC